MHFPILKDILILLGFSVVIVFLLQRFRIPSILGFLLTGILIGPYGLGLVHSTEEMELISEIGIIFLLFLIGIEISVKSLVSIKKTVFIGGALQVGLTVAVTALIIFSLGYSWDESIFIGFLFSLSSTAIVLKILQDLNEIATPHGRNILGLLIFQDIIVVPMMLFTPILAGESSGLFGSIPLLIFKIALMVLIIVASAKFVVPQILYAVAKTKNKELFLLTAIALCFTVAFLTAEAGLSLALGAFLAGLIISESEYSHQVVISIHPFRELFISFFFISVGMLLDFHFFIEHVGVIILIVLAVLILKTLITCTVIGLLKYPPRTVLLTGISLFQVGEFSLILSKTGVNYGLLSETTNQYFLAVSIFTMLLTPFIIMFSQKITSRFFRIRVIKVFLRKMRASREKPIPLRKKAPYQNHLIIIGYGINGSNLARAAQYKNIPFIVIELNAETVRIERKKGIPILYGDGTQEYILESAHLSTARAVVVAISDFHATKTIISNIRNLTSSVYILVRTRYLKEMNDLLALGANDVIPEEFETSIEIFSRVLTNFLIPEDDIQEFAETVRVDNYQLFTRQRQSPKTFRPAQFPDFNITCLQVIRDSGEILGKPIKSLDLRKKYNINILGISRNGKILDSIHPEDVICQDDLLYIHGKPESINHFHSVIS